MVESNQKRNIGEKGFSLIELLIVLLIIAILAVMATRFASPRLHAIDYQAQRIMDMLREAKNKAITTQQTMRLVFNRDQKIVQLIAENEPDDPDDDREIRRIHLADDVDVIFDRLPKNMDSRPVELVPVPLLVFEDTATVAMDMSTSEDKATVAMDMSTSEDGTNVMLALYLQVDWTGYLQQNCDPASGVCVYCKKDVEGEWIDDTCRKCMNDGTDPACPDSSTPTPTPTPGPTATPTPSPSPSPSPTGSPKPTPTPPDGPDTATYRYHRSGIVIDAGMNSVGDGSIVKGVTILLWTPQLDENGAPTENAQMLRAITVIGATGTSRFWTCPIVEGRCTNWEK